MKTYSKTFLPDFIENASGKYERDSAKTDAHRDKKPFDKTGCILVKVMSNNLKGREDFHGKPYQPTEWIFSKVKD